MRIDKGFQYYKIQQFFNCVSDSRENPANTRAISEGLKFCTTTRCHERITGNVCCESRRICTSSEENFDFSKQTR